MRQPYRLSTTIAAWPTKGDSDQQSSRKTYHVPARFFSESRRLGTPLSPHLKFASRGRGKSIGSNRARSFATAGQEDRSPAFFRSAQRNTLPCVVLPPGEGTPIGHLRGLAHHTAMPRLRQRRCGLLPTFTPMPRPGNLSITCWGVTNDLKAGNRTTSRTVPTVNGHRYRAKATPGRGTPIHGVEKRPRQVGMKIAARQPLLLSFLLEIARLVSNRGRFTDQPIRNREISRSLQKAGTGWRRCRHRSTPASCMGIGSVKNSSWVISCLR